MSIEEVLDAPVAIDCTREVEFTQENPLIDQLSEPLVGKWNALVSQTNWEKGALILRWRNKLIAAEQPNTVYSDEAWARRAGNVTAQHVGRLRRVAERFDETYRDFAGLYWSHFYAALEWDDAELWLEGAVQGDWSVAKMQVERWDALGVSEAHKPQEEDIIVMGLDEETYDNRIEGRNVEIGAVDTVGGFDPVPAPDTESPKKKGPKKSKTTHSELGNTSLSTGELLMSLKEVVHFPADVAEPLELLKVAILNHKLSGWKAISAEQMHRSLDSLKMLIMATD
jgi:hypothetical protein